MQVVIFLCVTYCRTGPVKHGSEESRPRVVLCYRRPVCNSQLLWTTIVWINMIHHYSFFIKVLLYMWKCVWINLWTIPWYLIQDSGLLTGSTHTSNQVPRKEASHRYPICIDVERKAERETESRSNRWAPDRRDKRRLCGKQDGRTWGGSRDREKESPSENVKEK